jgi:hypothetical protein
VSVNTSIKNHAENNSETSNQLRNKDQAITDLETFANKRNISGKNSKELPYFYLIPKLQKREGIHWRLLVGSNWDAELKNTCNYTLRIGKEMAKICNAFLVDLRSAAILLISSSSFLPAAGSEDQFAASSAHNVLVRARHFKWAASTCFEGAAGTFDVTRGQPGLELGCLQQRKAVRRHSKVPSSLATFRGSMVCSASAMRVAREAFSNSTRDARHSPSKIRRRLFSQERRETWWFFRSASHI